MSWHSKWHSIKHKKGAADKARGKIFTKHAKLITMSAKSWDDPEMNPGLKSAIENAKAANVPNDNIKRAIQKWAGTWKDGPVNYDQLNYEGYAPGGISVIMEVLTDNVNRSNTNVRAIFEKNGWKMWKSWSVSFAFKDKGRMDLLLEWKDKDEVEMEVIESWAEDLEFWEDRVFITTAFEDLGSVRDYLKGKWFTLENIKIDKIPNTMVEVTDVERARKFLELIDKVNEDDDVSEVYHNAEFTEEVLDSL